MCGFVPGLAHSALISFDDSTDTVTVTSSGFLVTPQNPQGTANCSFGINSESFGCSGSFYSNSPPAPGIVLFGDARLNEIQTSPTGDPILSDLVQFNVVSSTSDQGATDAGFSSLVTITVSLHSDLDNGEVSFRRAIPETGLPQDITGEFYDPSTERLISLPQNLSIVVTSDVPEPDSGVLLVTGLIGIWLLSRRRVEQLLS
jgi:hypothetical protein